MAYTEEDELKYKGEGMGVPYQDGTTGADGEPKVSVSSRSGYSNSSQSGSSDTQYGSETQSQRQSTGSSSSRLKPAELKDMPDLEMLDVPDVYTPVDYGQTERANMFRDMLRNAEAKRGRAAEANLSEQERLRRRGKYRAWTNLLNSMGQIAGRGYAPVSEEEDKRVLDSYKQLDALRKEYDTLGDDDVNWIRKAMAQDMAKHYADQEKMRDLSIKERQNAQKANAKTINDAYKTYGEKTKEQNALVEAVSRTDGQSHTESQSQRTGSSGGTTTTVTTGGSGSGKTGRLHIGRDASIPVTSNAANQLRSIYDKFVRMYEKNPYGMEGELSGFYSMNINGVVVRMKNDDIAYLMNKYAKFDPKKQMDEFIKDFDAYSTYWKTDENGNKLYASGNSPYYNRHGIAEAVRNGKPVSAAAPQEEGAEQKPAQSQPAQSAADKYKQYEQKQ